MSRPGVPSVNRLAPFHLRAMVPKLMWFVPAFWSEYVPLHGLRRAWPDDMDLAWAPELVRELALRGLWLEQERLVSDPRVGGALTALVAGAADALGLRAFPSRG
jgi:hypothetical protein